MSAAVPPGHVTPIDRRALLRGGLLGTAALAAFAAQHTTGAGTLVDAARALVGSSVSLPVAGATGVRYPTAAAWERVLGDDVVLRTSSGTPTRAQVVDVRLTPASPHVELEGEAYSVLLDAPRLPAASALTVTIGHPDLDVPPLVVTPVNGDGSWQAIVDRRRPPTNR